MLLADMPWVGLDLSEEAVHRAMWREQWRSLPEPRLVEPLSVGPVEPSDLEASEPMTIPFEEASMQSFEKLYQRKRRAPDSRRRAARLSEAKTLSRFFTLLYEETKEKGTFTQPEETLLSIGKTIVEAVLAGNKPQPTLFTPPGICDATDEDSEWEKLETVLQAERYRLCKTYMLVPCLPPEEALDLHNKECLFALLSRIVAAQHS